MHTLDELLALNPHFSWKPRPGRYEEVALPRKKWNIHYHPLHRRHPLYEEVKKTARAHDAKVYIASGDTGADVRTAALMGNVSAKFFNQKACASRVEVSHARDGKQQSGSFPAQPGSDSNVPTDLTWPLPLVGNGWT